MRLYRKRRLRGQLCLRIQIGHTEIAALAEKGFIDPAEREDIGALEFAVSSFISDTLLGF
jgi:hypothetical protein